MSITFFCRQKEWLTLTIVSWNLLQSKEGITAISSQKLLCNERPVGCVSCKKKEKKIYEIGCLCVIPEFQGKGIGTQAIEFVKEFYKDWEEFTLITPADKLENVKFYSEKCGFNIESTEKDGNVKVVRLVLGKFWFTLEAITQ